MVGRESTRAPPGDARERAPGRDGYAPGRRRFTRREASRAVLPRTGDLAVLGRLLKPLHRLRLRWRSGESCHGTGGVRRSRFDISWQAKTGGQRCRKGPTTARPDKGSAAFVYEGL